MKLFLLTVKHFFRLKYREICVDEIDMDSWILVIILSAFWMGTLINIPIIIVANLPFAGNLGDVTGFAVLATLLETVIFILLNTFFKWLKENWVEAKRLAEREVK